MTLSQLKQALNTGTYTPKTEEELLTQAQARYTAEYGEKKLAAQQAHDRGVAALTEQEALLGSAYAAQAADSQKNVREQLSEAERSALAKGMQRSSYSAASLGNIRAAGESSLNALRQGLLQEQSRLARERAQLAGELSDKLAQYDISFAADVQAYLDSLRDQEYEREVAANQYADKIARALYEYELKAGKAVGGSSSGSSQKKTGTTTKAATPADKQVESQGVLDKVVGILTGKTTAATATARNKSTGISGILSQLTR